LECVLVIVELGRVVLLEAIEDVSLVLVNQFAVVLCQISLVENLILSSNDLLDREEHSVLYLRRTHTHQTKMVVDGVHIL
jgi:hypothetical protein